MPPPQGCAHQLIFFCSGPIIPSCESRSAIAAKIRSLKSMLCYCCWKLPHWVRTSNTLQGCLRPIRLPPITSCIQFTLMMYVQYKYSAYQYLPTKSEPIESRHNKLSRTAGYNILFFLRLRLWYLPGHVSQLRGTFRKQSIRRDYRKLRSCPMTKHMDNPTLRLLSL